MSTVTIDANSLRNAIGNLNQFNDRLKASLKIVGDRGAREMENYARQNRPWKDRTGNARQKLEGNCDWVNDKLLEVTINHGVDYGVWLELAMGRRYAILERSRDAVAQNVVDGWRSLLS